MYQKAVPLIMLQQNDNCVFCRICNGKEQSEILYKVYNVIGNTVCSVLTSTLLEKLPTKGNSYLLSSALGNIGQYYKSV